MWVDSGNLAMGRLDVQILKDLIGATGFYSPKSPQTPWHWVHPGTFAHFGMRKCCADPAISKRRPCCCCATTATKCDPCNEQSSLDHTNASFWLQKTMCNGALVGFQRDTPGYTSVLVPWVACALNRSCIAPLGPGGPSHRGNHRQDQAALTMLSHLHGMPCVDKELGAGFKLHQDNRWTNQSYCDTILNGVAHNAAVDMQSVTIDPATLAGLQRNRGKISCRRDASLRRRLQGPRAEPPSPILSTPSQQRTCTFTGHTTVSQPRTKKRSRLG
jgi:hypothetical protein